MNEDHKCFEVTTAEQERLGLGAVALKYQQHGFSVLGTIRGDKRPHPAYGREGGVHWATTDQRMVPWLWGQDKLAGIAVNTGRSGLMVIDLDVKHGHDGPGTFGRWMLDKPPIPIDVVVSTPSGGWHIYLRLPAGVRVPSRPALLDGVDVKSDDGYVLAPPSRVWVDTEGGRVLLPYRNAAGCLCSIPEAPPWFTDYVSFAPATGTPGPGSGEDAPDIAQLAQTGLPVGARNETLHRMACSLFRRYGT